MARTYPRSIHVRMTHEMYANLRRLATDDRKVAIVIREAVREHLDRQGDITGSRRYFVGRFKERVEWLERLMSWHLTLLTILVSEIGAILIQNLIEIPEQDRQNFSGPALLKIAEQRTIESGWRVRTRINQMIYDSELVQERESKA